MSAIASRHPDAISAAFVAFAACSIYVRTLAPDVVDADGGEFQFAAWNFGFVHPTGYPLFLILGGLFQHLIPVGNPAYRLNLFTALTAAFAVAMVYLAAYEIVRRRGVALIAAASFAITPMFWYDASAAETYALNAGFIALLMYIALRWRAQPTAKKIAVFCFVYGLALTHHRTIILWLPAFALFFFIVARTLRFTFYVPRLVLHILRFAFCVLLPLLLYLYIPLRAPVSPYSILALASGRDLVLYDNSAAGLINYFLGRTFQGELRWDAVSVARLASLPQLIFDQFGWMGFLLGTLGGLGMLRRKEWAWLVLLFAGAGATVLFAAIYHIGDIFHYYIPAYLVWAVLIAVGFGDVLDVIRNSRFAIRIGALLLLSFLFLIPQFFVNFPFADRSRETQHREQWTRILSAPILPNAILISNDRDEMMPLWYMQYVENTRRDVLGLFPLITPAPEHANIARLTDSVLDASRPIYFIKPMPGIEIKYRIEKSDLLWRVVASWQTRAPEIASDAMLAERVRVLGYDAVRAGDGLDIAVYWIPLEKLERNYTTFVHLLDAEGNKIAQGNDHQIGGGFYPTTMWSVGETLRDEQRIALPANIVPGKYTLVAGMYAQPDGEPLGDPIAFGTIEIK